MSGCCGPAGPTRPGCSTEPTSVSSRSASCGAGSHWRSSFQALTGRAEADTPTILVGAVFAVVGVYFIVGRFLVKAFRKRHTFYAVTDRRVLVLTDLGRRSLNAALIGQIPAIQKHVRTDGVGSLRFGTGGGLASMYEDTGLELFGAFYGAPAPAFVNIAGANDVAKLVTRLQAERPGS